MKWIILFIFLLFKNSIVSAQSEKDTSLEMILKVVQRTDSKSAKNLAFSLSVINHSSQSIYLPRAYNVDFYRKNGNVWEELDRNGNIKKINEIDAWEFHGMSPKRSDDDETWYKNLNKTFFKYYKLADSIEKKYVMINTKFKSINRYQLLFLKTGERVSEYIVIDRDFLLKNSGEYKVCINVFSKNVIDLSKYPSNIFEYNLYEPNKIISNTIYYSILP